ncbi:hypothetical protein KSP40_PGU000762 [Platanthera guangdongensis]|uniref:Uncharacterized protein n=1 Tax=Platanthera guangdongensis TaxID=2320717 RepID=A0ABR2LMA3_9ASPA
MADLRSSFPLRLQQILSAGRPVSPALKLESEPDSFVSAVAGRSGGWKRSVRNGGGRWLLQTELFGAFLKAGGRVETEQTPPEHNDISPYFVYYVLPKKMICNVSKSVYLVLDGVWTSWHWDPKNGSAISTPVVAGSASRTARHLGLDGCPAWKTMNVAVWKECFLRQAYGLTEFVATMNAREATTKWALIRRCMRK